jgi:hypothetical protein
LLRPTSLWSLWVSEFLVSEFLEFMGV